MRTLSWNAILSINVLEHIESDADELATYFRLLKPARGALCLFVPARPDIYAPIDKDFGHFRRYTRCRSAKEARAHRIQDSSNPILQTLSAISPGGLIFAC